MSSGYYKIESDCMTLEFKRKTEDGAIRQLHTQASATPDVQCNLYEWDAENDAWAWVSTYCGIERFYNE